MRIEKLKPEDWRYLAEDVHKVVFEERKPMSLDRIDYALLVVDEKPQAYVTVREIDSESAYFQYGGAFPETKGTAASYECWKTVLGWAQEHYKRINFLVENDNKPMLRMAMSADFKTGS